MSSTLVFHGDYFKGVESVTKAFELKSVEWIIESDTGNIVETDEKRRVQKRSVQERKFID
ncbi:hypothetical protein RhiirA5_354577 [Rhizophagus irregularis]|uniref:Uncharacterized protein n=1 Tax=Rhizophagus irregularis TaxID=588596 RepID=A0A2N0PWI9_9GLOM|nr:hypothetical protein RhiirA5_354577 [Rhizophagus irregularis]